MPIDSASAFYITPPVIGFFVMMALASISVLRAERNRTNILFAVICFLGGLINIDTALVSLARGGKSILWFDRSVHFLFVFIVPVYIQFIHSFLNIKGRRWLPAAAYACSAFLLFFVPTDLYFSGYYTYFFGVIAKAGPVFHVFSLAIAATVAYCLYGLIAALRSETDNQKRNRIKYIFGGMGVSSFLLLFHLLPVSGIEFYPLGNFSFVPAMFLAYGVLKYDLLDVGSLIKRGTIYFILTGILTILYILVIYVFNAFFINFGYRQSFIVPFLFALFVVLIFNPLQRKIRASVDRLFFRGRYNYRRILKDISADMVSLLNFEAIRDLILKFVSRTLRLTTMSLMIFDWPVGGVRWYRGGSSGEVTCAAADALIRPGHPLVAYFEKGNESLSKAMAVREFKEKPDRDLVLEFFTQLQATLIVPMIYKNRLGGLLVLGQKKSDEIFVDEDIQLLVTIANQSIIAIENAKSYEAVEQFNRELEEKVMQRTRALSDALLEKERTQQQLIQSESLAAIGQLVAGTAHELNNPLATASSLVQSGIETLEEDKSARVGEVRDDLQYALKEMKRAGGIVRSLLGLSRQTTDYLEPVNINAVIEDALRVLFNQYKHKRIEIERRYEEALPEIEGNFANLGQVFINIIQNSIQAIGEEEGKIVLKTSHDRDRNTVIAECTDTGAGIEENHLKDIFKPFFTTKAVGEGTGLGLYICHEIVKKHEGDINISSAKGRGTAVVIEIPCRRRAA